MTNWSTLPLASFDLETTGVDVLDARVVSYSLILRGPDVDETHTAILNPGIEIPIGASNVHGITTERAIAEGIDYETGMRELVALLTRAAYTYPIVAFNASYDFSVMHVEMARLGLGLFPAGTTVIDPFFLDKTFDKYRRGPRRLSDVSAHYGVELTNAHDAVADTEAALDLTRALMDKYGRGLSPRQIHESTKGWARESRQSLINHRARNGGDTNIEMGWPVLDNARALAKSLRG